VTFNILIYYFVPINIFSLQVFIKIGNAVSNLMINRTEFLHLAVIIKVSFYML
jgi:hypothetical protein